METEPERLGHKVLRIDAENANQDELVETNRLEIMRVEGMAWQNGRHIERMNKDVDHLFVNDAYLMPQYCRDMAKHNGPLASLFLVEEVSASADPGYAKARDYKFNRPPNQEENNAWIPYDRRGMKNILPHKLPPIAPTEFIINFPDPRPGLYASDDSPDEEVTHVGASTDGPSSDGGVADVPSGTLS